MRYLFFDIECANSFDGTGKICEFGYVLTDEKLSEIDHGIFLVNPDSEFEQYVLLKILKYKKEDYLVSPKYPEVYCSHVKHLLEERDTILVGHGARNDVKFLYDESKRYSLALPPLDVVDAAVIWQRYHNDAQTRNLKKLVNELGIGNPKILHNSEYDARMTLEYSKLLCAKSGLSFKELSEKYFPISDRTELLNYPKTLEEKSIGKKSFNNLNVKKKNSRRTFREIVKRIEPIGVRSNALKNQRVSISDNYTSDHFKDLLNIIGLIKAAGGEYEIYAERSDIFCTFDKIDDNGKPIPDQKISFVKSAILKGKKINQIPLEALFEILDLTKESLAAMPKLNVEQLFDEKIKNKETVNV